MTNWKIQKVNLFHVIFDLLLLRSIYSSVYICILFTLLSLSVFLFQKNFLILFDFCSIAF